MAIHIITDSAADYSAQEIERRGITCIPMSVSFGDEHYMDGVNLTKEEFFEKLVSQPIFPKTAQPSPMAFMEQFKKAKETGDTVIAILISSELSGTLQAATMAKDMLEYDKIYIVDSKSVTLGMRILIDRALVLREQGKSAEEIINELENLRGRIRIYAGLDTLEYLYKGGRLTRGEATVGNLVNLKPMVTVTQQGNVELCGKQIGIRHVYKQLAKIVREDAPDMEYPIYFVYSYDKKNCAGFIQYLQKKELDFGVPKLRGIGPTIGSHVGTGAFGIVYVEQE